MNKIIYIALLLLLTSTLSAQNWIEVRNGLPESWSKNASISAIDENNAVIAIYIYPKSYIYKTIDNGRNWELLGTPEDVDEYLINDITMIDKDNIWFCTVEDNPEKAKIYYSNDGGLNWTKQFEDKEFTTYFNYIKMFDELNGIAMGDTPYGGDTDRSVFLKTDSGGMSWDDSLNIGFFPSAFAAAKWRSVDFTTFTHGFFIPSYIGITSKSVYSTTNSGGTWIEHNQAGQLNIVKLFNKSIAVVFGNDAGIITIYKTSDFGSTWLSHPTNVNESPVDVEFLRDDNNYMWLTTGDLLLYTPDFGYNWYDYTPSLDFYGIDLEVVDENHGWLLTENSVFYIDDAEVYPSSNLNNDNIGSVKEYSLEQNYPNPFNPTTTISFTIPESNNVNISIYDVLGNSVYTIVNKYHSAGTYSYSFDAKGEQTNLASGLYFYRMQAGKYTNTRKMILLK